MRRLLYGLAVACGCCWVCTIAGNTSRASVGPDRVLTRYVSESGATLEQLTAGAAGQGVLLYYLESRGPDHPTLAVRLSKKIGASVALAQVYQPFPGSATLPTTVSQETLEVGPQYDLAITIQTEDGWWVRDGKPSYNLNIRIYGPMYSMWGASYDPQEFRFGGWPSRVSPGEPAVDITVRDPKHTGIPLWEWRSLIPPFEGSAYFRTNYAESKCARPRRIVRSVSPLWPYIATAQGYEQVVGLYSPPIGVDWQHGMIVYFSELVTVRNQACSYALYTLSSLDPRIVNRVDFEAPFAFYDLSGHNVPYPDLIVRTEHYPALDEWTTNFFYPQYQVATPSDIEWIRYSWAEKPAYEDMEYKVDVMGTNPFTTVTSLAGGALKAEAPSYDTYPAWVVNRSWPIVTFVATDGTNYVSNEGIYEYSSHDAGPAYLLGWEDAPRTDSYQIAQAGLRSEYRVSSDSPPRLYFSPVDDRLHLLDADGGIWDLGDGQVITLHNLAGSPYIDSWTLEKGARVPLPESTARGYTASGKPLQQLYALDGFLIYAGANGVQVKESPYRPALFEASPPTDSASWNSLGARLRHYAGTPRDSVEMATWIDNSPGAELTLTSASIDSVRAWTGGFQFTLHLKPGFQIGGRLTHLLGHVHAGDFLLKYNGRMATQPLTPPVLSATIAQKMLTLQQLQPNLIPIVLHNFGLQDVSDATLELWAGLAGEADTKVATRTVALLGGQHSEVTMQWAPPEAGTWAVMPKLRLPGGGVFSYSGAQIRVIAPDASTINVVLNAGGSVQSTLTAVSLLAVVAVLAIVGLLARTYAHDQGRSR